MEVLRFGVDHLLVPIVFWSVVFMGGAGISGMFVAKWLSRRTPGPGPARTWPAQVVLIAGCFLLPAGVALFHAVPFAWSRGVASGIESATPAVTGWLMDLTTSEAMKLFDVKDSEVALDISAVTSTLAAAIEAREREAARGSAGILALARIEGLKLLDRTMRTIAPNNGRITWRELERAARERAIADSRLFLGVFVASLRASALGYLISAVFLTLACQALAVVGYRLISSSPPPLDPASASQP